MTKKTTPAKKTNPALQPHNDWERIRDQFDTDGIWIVSGKQHRMRNVGFGGYDTVRKIGRLLDRMELMILCGFEQHRDVLIKAVDEILKRHTTGISPDAGATIIIDAVHKATMDNMKDIQLDERDR